MAESRKVRVSKRSGFDKTFRNTLTGNVGTLIPIFFDEVIPDTKVNLKINLAASLPPLVSDTYMNVRLKVEAFAVPHRLLYGNFEDFFADYPSEYINAISSSDSTVSYSKYSGCVPTIVLGSSNQTADAALSSLTGNGSLADYLGYHSEGSLNSEIVNALGFAAYHLIWQEWYRNPRVQRPAFLPFNHTPIRTQSNLYASSLPFYKCYFTSGGAQAVIAPDTSASAPLYCYTLADGTNILSLRQRNFALDYFTGAMVEPQQGDMAKVTIDANDQFTIASLRAQNSIQQFRERNNLTSPRYQQQIYARYGTAPSDGVLQRPALIGAASYDVYSHGVTQTSESGASSTSNPFLGSLGARGGNGFAAGQDFIIKGFHAKEPMFIMVLASLVPDVTYAQGINPVLKRYMGVGSITDMANNILQNVGPQVLPARELFSTGGAAVFAYADRYADWMFIKNQVHGEFHYGATLASFVLQRYFASVPQFGSSFLEIPTDYLDGVLTASAAVTGFAYWMDSMLEYKVSMPLQEYSIPSLQDPAYEHGRSITLRKNGQLL